MKYHCILTLGRSGSNALVDLINQNPQIYNFGEVLGGWSPLRKIQQKGLLLQNNDRDYLDLILSDGYFLDIAMLSRHVYNYFRKKKTDAKSRRTLATIGIKEFSINFRDFGIPTYLEDRQDVKVVGLTRENVFDRMLSNELLDRTGVAAHRSGKVNGHASKFVLDPDSVLHKLEIIERENAELDQMLADLPGERRMAVTYEALYLDEASRRSALAQIFDFLEVRQHDCEIRMEKIVQGKSIDMLENASEIRSVVLGSRFSNYI